MHMVKLIEHIDRKQARGQEGKREGYGDMQTMKTPSQPQMHDTEVLALLAKCLERFEVCAKLAHFPVGGAKCTAIKTYRNSLHGFQLTHQGRPIEQR